MLATGCRVTGGQAHGPAAFNLGYCPVGHRRRERELLRIRIPRAHPTNVDTALESNDGALAVADDTRLTGYPDPAENARDIGRLDTIGLDFEPVNRGAC